MTDVRDPGVDDFRGQSLFWPPLPRLAGEGGGEGEEAHSEARLVLAGQNPLSPETGEKGQNRRFPVRKTSYSALLLLTAFAAGCQQKMADQPSYRRQKPSAFFADGSSSRPLPEGVVAREFIRSDDALMSGLNPQVRANGPHPAGAEIPASAAADDPAKFADAAPFALTDADLKRGQRQFTIYCTVCHGPLGNGAGKIVERGYVHPPDYAKDPSRAFARYGKPVMLRDAPIGYIYEVITKGYGAMPRYGPMIEPADRWRVAAYVQALQLSRHAELAKLPSDERQAAQAELEKGTP